MPHLISADVAARYTAAPAATTVAGVKSLHESIRSVIGDSHETFLQGSYRNDTSIPDLNDVDIVAIRKTTYSTYFTGRPSTNPILWETIFDEVRTRLEASHYYRGKTTTRDKCINVAAGFSADVVPAVEIVNATTDPIAIYSRSRGKERQNSPRIHHENGKAKHQATNDRYKPTVRMFKRWCRQVLPDPSVAPSFYVECLIYNFTDASFVPDEVDRFANLASFIVDLRHDDQRIKTVADDKLVLAADEWGAAAFAAFQHELRGALELVRQAIGARAQSDAERLWRAVFHD